MSRVGILGGTFDPPHRAHVAMARAALERIPLQRVLFMPAKQPPHKESGAVSPYEVRVRMVELATEEQDGFEVSRIEEERAGPSFTAELLSWYHERHDDDVYLILGADSMSDLMAWKTPRRVLEQATIVVFPRSGYSSVLPVAGDGGVVLFEAPLIDVSSTDIRSRARAGKPIASLVSAAVEEFILDNSLYS